MLTTMVSFGLSFLRPVAPFVVLVVLLVLVDLWTGRRAARHRGETIKSKQYRDTLRKLMDYLVAILLARAVDVVFLESSQVGWLSELSLVWPISALVALVELKSNYENLAQTTGLNFWQVIANRLRKHPGMPRYENPPPAPPPPNKEETT